MALNKTVLKNLMAAKIAAVSDFPQSGQTPSIVDDRILEALADAIVTHITTDAVVLPDSLNNPLGQPISVTTGPGSGSTGATSAPQTIAGTGKVQ